MPKIEDIEKTLKDKFHYKNISTKLGEGASGVVLLFENTETKHKMAVKFNPTNVDLNEAQLATYLYNATQPPTEHMASINEFLTKHPDKEFSSNDLLTLGLPLVDDNNQIIAIAYEYAHYTNEKGNVVASNLENRAKSMFYQFNGSNGNDSKTLQEVLLNYTADIIGAQHRLHELNVFHLDTSCRNILISDNHLKIADYGLSIVVDNLSATFQQQIRPSRWTDPEAQLTGVNVGNKKLSTVSLNTELFARRAAIAEMLGIVLGKSQSEIFNYGTESTQDPVQLREQRSKYSSSPDDIAAFVSSNTELTRLVANLNKFVNACSNPVIKEAAANFLTAFSPFLTQLPSGASVEERFNNDITKYNECYQAFLKLIEVTQSQVLQSQIAPQRVDTSSTQPIFTEEDALKVALNYDKPKEPFEAAKNQYGGMKDTAELDSPQTSPLPQNNNQTTSSTSFLFQKIGKPSEESHQHDVTPLSEDDKNRERNKDNIQNQPVSTDSLHELPGEQPHSNDNEEESKHKLKS